MTQQILVMTGAGGHFDVNSAGTDKIESGSTTVFIGTTAPTITEPTLLEATDNLTIDEDPVATVKTAYGFSSLDIDKTYADAIITGRNAERAAGFDPDTNEGIVIRRWIWWRNITYYCSSWYNQN